MTITASATRRILRRQGMPPQEIRAVLAAEDPLIVRRLMELHRERLEEWLEEQRRLAAGIKRSLADERERQHRARRKTWPRAATSLRITDEGSSSRLGHRRIQPASSGGDGGPATC